MIESIAFAALALWFAAVLMHGLSHAVRSPAGRDEPG